MKAFRLSSSVVLSVIAAAVVGAQRPLRNEHACHSSQLDECARPLQRFREDPNATAVVAEERLFDHFCRSLEEDVLGCVSRFVARCGTPAYKELAKVIIDHMISHVREICAKDSKFRKEVFATMTGRCLHEKVLSQHWFHEKCNQLIPTLVANQSQPLSAQIDVTCCAFARWEDDCALPAVRAKCGDEGARVLRTLVRKGSADLPDFLCKERRTTACAPPDATKASLEMDLLTFFAFLFKRDQKL